MIVYVYEVVIGRYANNNMISRCCLKPHKS